MLDLFSHMSPLQRALDYHLERHNVLATNIAHVDTPGFRPRDLARIRSNDFGEVFDVQLAKTSTEHLSLAGESGPSRVGKVFEDASGGAGNDENYVSLDRESAKLAANHLRYDVMSTIIASELKGLMYAANDGKG